MHNRVFFSSALCCLTGLSCYGTGRFYVFLKQLFLSFGFPDLNDFLSLIPADRQAQVFLLYDTDRTSESLTNRLSGSQ